MVMAKVDEYNMYILLLSGRSNCHACCCYYHNQYASHGCYDGDCFDNASCPPESYCNEMLTLINTVTALVFVIRLTSQHSDNWCKCQDESLRHCSLGYSAQLSTCQAKKCPLTGCGLSISIAVRPLATSANDLGSGVVRWGFNISTSKGLND